MCFPPVAAASLLLRDGRTEVAPTEFADELARHSWMTILRLWRTSAIRAAYKGSRLRCLTAPHPAQLFARNMRGAFGIE